MKNDCLTVALEELSAAGIRDVVRAHGAKHWQLRWRGANGVERVYTIPCTPGDVRSVANARAAIRRILRDDGMLAAERKPTAPPKQPDRITLLERRLADVERYLAVLKQKPGLAP
jgi:hypothetical protein